MKSPVTGKEMFIHKEGRTIEFRKEVFTVMYHYYSCKESDEKFTSAGLDDININQVYNQYRDKYNLPFPEEIKSVREMYDLPANKMAEILGLGVNSYRNYENGEVPSNANGKLIQLASDPKKFKQLIELAETLDEPFRINLLKRIEKLIEDNEKNVFSIKLEDYLLDGKLPDEFSGYKKPNFKKLTEMVVFFTEQMQPWKTQMNKLLFYADFLLFKRTCFSMSGARYRAINMGPVPNNYNSIFEYISKNDDIDIWHTEFDSGAIGEQFKAHPGRTFNNIAFSQIELATLKDIVNKFKDKKTSDIIEISHQEKAWLENEKDKKIISYKYAFDLSQI
ncbi:MAG: type II toxin-antitoxin system antitoxin SocA domain-containing protein [Bacteroidia bacterium]